MSTEEFLQFELQDTPWEQRELQATEILAILSTLPEVSGIDPKWHVCEHQAVHLHSLRISA